MKPAYVTVEFWRENRDDTATIEGWLTNDDDKYLFVTPTLDYDVEVMKFAIPNDKIISITPAQSVRAYAKPLEYDGTMGIDGRITWNK